MKYAKLLSLICWIALLTLPGTLGAAEPPAEESKKVKRIRAVVVGGEPGGTSLDWVDDEKVEVRIVGPEVNGLAKLRPRGFLGIEITELTPELRAHFGTPQEAGVLVASVLEDGPAAAAGVRVGDVITAIDGETVKSTWDVQSRIGSLDEGDLAAIELIRDGELQTVNATVEERQRPQVDVGHMLRHLPRFGKDGEPLVLHFQGDGLPEMIENLEQLRSRIESPEFRRRVIDLRSRESELLERLETLEKRLQGLEEELQDRDR